MTKYRLIFTDGSTEIVDVFGPFTAWLTGKSRARAKKTYLLNIEEIHGSSVTQKPEDVWREAELFLRKHGYIIDKDKFTDFFPSWIWMVQREYLDEGKFREAVAFVIHEAVECEELKRIVGYWIWPRDYDLKCLQLKDIIEYKKCMDKHVDAHLKAEEMEKLYLSTFPVETKGSLTPQLLILERVSVPGPEVKRARV
jgi:hypothetical protein